MSILNGTLLFFRVRKMSKSNDLIHFRNWTQVRFRINCGKKGDNDGLTSNKISNFRLFLLL